MKLTTTILFSIAWSIGSANALVSVPKTRQEFLQGFAAAAGLVVLATPQISHADADSVFNGQFSDPKHPNCKRIISTRDGDVKLSGTDGTPGCPEDGSGDVWRLTGQADGKTILVDFSPKGGPANLKGVWDGDGIKWPDGNKWTLKN